MFSHPQSLKWKLKAFVFGAGDGNRTHVFSLEGCCTTIVLRPHILPNGKFWHYTPVFFLCQEGFHAIPPLLIFILSETENYQKDSLIYLCKVVQEHPINFAI